MEVGVGSLLVPYSSGCFLFSCPSPSESPEQNVTSRLEDMHLKVVICLLEHWVLYNH